MNTLLILVCVVLLIQIIVTWICCSQVKKALTKIYAWAEAMHDPVVCAVLSTECEPGAGSGWPPDSPGTFPPSET